MTWWLIGELCWMTGGIKKATAVLLPWSLKMHIVCTMTIHHHHHNHHYWNICIAFRGGEPLRVLVFNPQETAEHHIPFIARTFFWCLLRTANMGRRGKASCCQEEYQTHGMAWELAQAPFCQPFRSVDPPKQQLTGQDLDEIAASGLKWVPWRT